MRSRNLCRENAILFLELEILAISSMRPRVLDRGEQVRRTGTRPASDASMRPRVLDREERQLAGTRLIHRGHFNSATGVRSWRTPAFMPSSVKAKLLQCGHEC